MSGYRIELDTGRCQSYGNCLNVAPAVFAWTRARKVRIANAGGAADDRILKAAKLCPYRAIAIIDDATGTKIFPPRLTR
ncbi:MAG TPA: ferredoxin [Stellaceae bacterium]|nr:ferredoxin [Stellaceae bacterium]